MKPLRILLYANVDAAEAGGVQGVVRALRSFLAGRGHRVTTGWAARSRAVTRDREQVDGWAEAFHPRKPGGRVLRLRTLARLAVRLGRLRPDVVHIHYAAPAALYFQALAPWLGFRVIITCHGSDILRPLDHDAPLLARTLAGAHAVTVVSEDLAAHIAGMGMIANDGPVVITNGVDTEFWHPPAIRELTDTRPRLVTIGRLERVKGFDILIEACAHLAERGQDVLLIIIGEGAEEKALAALAARRGIARSVNLAGRLPPSTIRALLHGAAAFVLPSRSEGMPLALMEALATGTPVIAADVGGVARTAGGAAVLVPPENPEALSDAIAQVITDQSAQAQLQQQGRAHALTLSMEAGHAAYEALLTRLARARRA